MAHGDPVVWEEQFCPPKRMVPVLPETAKVSDPLFLTMNVEFTAVEMLETDRDVDALLPVVVTSGGAVVLIDASRLVEPTSELPL